MLETHNMTQKELAMRVGCSQNAIHLYVTGKSEPTIGKLLKIEDAFGVKNGAFLWAYEMLTSNFGLYSPTQFETEVKAEWMGGKDKCEAEKS